MGFKHGHRIHESSTYCTVVLFWKSTQTTYSTSQIELCTNPFFQEYHTKLILWTLKELRLTSCYMRTGMVALTGTGLHLSLETWQKWNLTINFTIQFTKKNVNTKSIFHAHVSIYGCIGLHIIPFSHYTHYKSCHHTNPKCQVTITRWS
jgi:hypothetical protein